MSSKSDTRGTDRESRSRRLRDQPTRFLGIFLAPLAGLLAAWGIHLYVTGWHVAGWVVKGSPTAQAAVSTLAGVAALGLALTAWHFAEHRKTPMRVALTGSTGSIVALFGINAGTGPHRWWAFLFVLTGWYVAGTWSLTRLDVTRQDPRAEGPKEDTVLEKLGLKGWGFKVKHREVDPETGDPIRTEISVNHAPGETVDKLQAAVPAFESLAGAPRGYSTATGTDAANRSNLVIIHRDILKYRIPYGPLTHPGGSIADPISFALYADNRPVWCHLAAGKAMPSSTGYGFMGMTRTGKTIGENEMLTEVESRTDVVIFYLNKAKGRQDIRPVIPGIEACVIADDGEAGTQEYKAGLQMVQRIITYREGQLARFGISSWSPRCYATPPSRFRPDGTKETMEPMPALIVHVGEADAILERAGDIAVYISSKGLSTGIIPGYSLQRASAEHMPTGLRFNIGAWWVFGCGDEYSAGFALTDSVLAAGAHPENWKQSKPGYHYFMGPGVDEDLYPKMARTESQVGGNSTLPFDQLDELLQNEMLRRNLASAPAMARLDRGSAEATGMPGEPGNRWDLLVRKTDMIRNDLLGGTANMTPTDRNLGPQSREPFAVIEPQDDETAEHMTAVDEVDEMIAETTEVDGLELYPRDPAGETAEFFDLSTELPPPPDDLIEFADQRPEPPSKAEALRAMYAVLDELLDLPELRDPADASGNTAIIQVKDVTDRLKFRSRPWFSGEFSALADGKRTPPPGKSLERAPDLGLTAGRYRLRRVFDHDQ